MRFWFQFKSNALDFSYMINTAYKIFWYIDEVLGENKVITFRKQYIDFMIKNIFKFKLIK